MTTTPTSRSDQVGSGGSGHTEAFGGSADDVYAPWDADEPTGGNYDYGQNEGEYANSDGSDRTYDEYATWLATLDDTAAQVEVTQIEAAHVTSDDEGTPLPSENELLDRLNVSQSDAVSYGDGALMVVAGPGSGKTRVLTHRIAMLLRRDVKPWRILAVTFTNKAAGEMRDRLVSLVGQGAVDAMWVSTFHAACVRILRREHVAAGLPRSFTILDSDDSERLVRRILKDLSLVIDDKEARGLAGQIRDQISSAKSRLVTPEQAERTSGVSGLAEVMYEYQERLDAMGACDFDDLLLRTLRLLDTDPVVRSHYRQKFRYVLVDEFQDTNPVQLAITRHLADGYGNLCVVGDGDQSIYAWRQADPTGLLRFTEMYPGAGVVVLNQNYRSTKAILEVCRAIIAPNEATHRADLWTDNDDGAPVVGYEAADDRDEARWVLDHIIASRRPYSDHAILVRTNAQSRSIEEALGVARVPYKLVGGTRFYERAEVRDALAWLKVATNPADIVSFERASGAPRRGIGEKTVSSLIAQARADGDDLIEAVRVAAHNANGKASLNLAAYHGALQAVAEAAVLGPVDAAKAALDATGLRAHWAAQVDGEGRVENLDELVNAAAEFTATGRAADGTPLNRLSPHDRTLAFLEHAALVSAADDTGDAQVQILTAHSAKGREFPFVYVVGLEEKIFPHARALNDDDELAEERRLVFVAVSRAMERLHLSWCRQRFMYGKLSELEPSRFLDDLPESVQRTKARIVVRQVNSYGSSARPSWQTPHWQQRPSTPAPRVAVGPSGMASRNPVSTAAPKGPVVGNTGERVAAEELSAGTKVSHPAFGDGTIIGVKGNYANIRFGRADKTLDVTIAPLILAA